MDSFSMGKIVNDGFAFNGESFNVCVLQWEKFLNVCVFQWHFWLRFIQLEKFLNVCVLQWHFWLRFIQCVFFQWEIFDGRFLMVDSFNVFVLSIGNFRWQNLSMVDIQWKKL